MNKDSLVEIPVKEWPKLRDLYVDRKLETNSFNMIQNFINWLEQDPSLKDFVKCYSLNGDWSDGTFLLQDHETYVMVNTIKGCHQRVLASLKCLNKTPNLLIFPCPPKLKPTFEEYLIGLGIEKESYERTNTILYHLEQEKAFEFNIEPPEGLTLSPLRNEDTETINNLWPHSRPGSNEFIERLIRLSLNVGVYDEKNNLVGWCLTLTVGALGLLQVQESHKRMGLGSLLVKAMAKMNAEKGIDILAPVVEDNAASRGMFKKLGFQEIDKINWLQKPAGK